MVARSVDTDWALVTERPGTGAGDWAATAETGETKHEWGDRGDKERALVSIQSEKRQNLRIISSYSDEDEGDENWTIHGEWLAFAETLA